MAHSTLSDAARVLSAVAEHAGGLALPPERLAVAARDAVVLPLLQSGLVEEPAAEDDQQA